MSITKKLAALSAVALISLSFASTADAGVRDWFRRHMPRPAPRYVAPAPVYVAPPVHVHAYNVATQQIWVPPVTQQVFVGYSPFGFAQYETRTIQGGYYRTVTFHVCSCGHRIG